MGVVDIYNSSGIGEFVANPTYIPHESDPRIGDHHFSFTQPCPEGKASIICSMLGLLSGRPQKGGEKIKNRSTKIKDKAKLAAAKTFTNFSNVFKSPDWVPTPTVGIKDSRNALLNNGVVRAIKDRQINPNNVPYIMNEGKLKNYLQLLSWYFAGDILLNKEQIDDNMTVRAGKRIDNRGKGAAKVFSDDMRRENAAFSLAVDPSIKPYMPKLINSRRLIANANNVALGNYSNKHLTKEYSNKAKKAYRGRYGKRGKRGGDDLALAFWLGLR